MANPKSPPAQLITQADLDFVRISLRRLGIRREADRDDLTGLVLLDFVRCLDQYDPERPVRPWLFGFARHRAWVYRRRNRIHAGREQPLPRTEDLEPASSDPDPHEHAVARSRLAMLDAMLSELPRVEAQVLLLYEGTAMELAEVAVALGVPYGTAASRLFLARKNLRAARARLAHRGETWAAVPPLTLLLSSSEAWHADADADEPPPAPRPAPRVSPALPPSARPGAWTSGGILAGLAGVAAVAACAVVLSRCDAPAPPPLSIVHEATVAESRSEPAPAPSSAPSSSPGAASLPVASAPLRHVAGAPPREDLGAEEVKAEANAARMSLARGEAGAALATLERLDRRERRGLLSSYRESLRIEALARLGRLPEARARLARLRQAAPGDPLLDRLERVLAVRP